MKSEAINIVFLKNNHNKHAYCEIVNDRVRGKKYCKYRKSDKEAKTIASWEHI